MKKIIVSVISFIVVLVLEIVLVCVTITNLAEQSAVDSVNYCSDTISKKVDETINLLTALSNTSSIQGDSLTYREKAVSLTKISKQFGYMMIRIVDEDLVVYSESSSKIDGRSSDLSSREYLQKLKYTLVPQVTDVFRAGVDGVTRNYTVAVPILTDGVFKGALFAAIYETEFSSLLKEHNSILVGSNLQYMSGIDDEDVGFTLDEEFKDVFFFTSTSEERMTEIKSVEITEGSFLTINNSKITTYAYNKVDSANWNVISRVTWGDIIASNVIFFIMMIFTIIATIFMFIVTLNNTYKKSKKDFKINMTKEAYNS